MRRHLGVAGDEDSVGAGEAVDALRERDDLGLLTLDGRLHVLDRALVLGEATDLLGIDLRVGELVLAHLADARFARVEAREERADLRLNRLELARGIGLGLGDVRRGRLLGLHAYRREVLVDLADETRAGRGV